jgi:hypothetical protein
VRIYIHFGQLTEARSKTSTHTSALLLRRQCTFYFQFQRIAIAAVVSGFLFHFCISLEKAVPPILYCYLRREVERKKAFKLLHAIKSSSLICHTIVWEPRPRQLRIGIQRDRDSTISHDLFNTRVKIC